MHATHQQLLKQVETLQVLAISAVFAVAHCLVETLCLVRESEIQTESHNPFSALLARACAMHWAFGDEWMILQDVMHSY